MPPSGLKGGWGGQSGCLECVWEVYRRDMQEYSRQLALRRGESPPEILDPFEELERKLAKSLAQQQNNSDRPQYAPQLLVLKPLQGASNGSYTLLILCCRLAACCMQGSPHVCVRELSETPLRHLPPSPDCQGGQTGHMMP